MWQILFSWTPKPLQMVTTAMILKDAWSLEGKLTNLDIILQNRNFFAYKSPYGQSYGFPSGHVWMWELDHKEGWTPKNWCFWIVVLEKILESPWTSKRSNQPILKEIKPKYTLEGLIPKLKLQYFHHLMQRANWLEKTMILGKIKGRRRRRQQRKRWLDSIIDTTDMSLSKLWEIVKDREVWHAAVPGVMKSWTIRKAEHWRVDAFELWCWKRLLRVPWTTISQSQRKSILNIHWKDWCASTLATWCKEPTHWKRTWCCERLRAGGEGGHRGWDGWMASPTQWTWVWVNFRT